MVVECFDFRQVRVLLPAPKARWNQLNPVHSDNVPIITSTKAVSFRRCKEAVAKMKGLNVLDEPRGVGGRADRVGEGESDRLWKGQCDEYMVRCLIWSYAYCFSESERKVM